MLNKKIILGIFTIGMLAVVATAGTFAYFSSSVSSNGNTIKTGTINLALDAGSVTLPFTSGLLVPGDEMAATTQGTLRNAGTSAGDLTGKITVTSNQATLPQDMKIKVKVGANAEQTLALGDNPVVSQKLVSGGTAPIVVTLVYPDTGAEQTGQGAVINIDSTFNLKSNPAYYP